MNMSKDYGPLGPPKADPLGIPPQSAAPPPKRHRPQVPVKEYPLLYLYSWAMRGSAVLMVLAGIIIAAASVDAKDYATAGIAFVTFVGAAVLQLAISEGVRAFVDLVQNAERNSRQLQDISETLSQR